MENVLKKGISLEPQGTPETWVKALCKLLIRVYEYEYEYPTDGSIWKRKCGGW